MKHVSILFSALAFAFIFTSCAEDNLTDAVTPSSSLEQGDIETSSAACRPWDIAVDEDMEFQIAEAKGVKVDFSRPGGLRITGGLEYQDATLGVVNTTVDVIYQFYTNRAVGTVQLLPQAGTDFVELSLGGRQASVDKYSIQVPIIGVTGSGEYRVYNVATGMVTLTFQTPLAELRNRDMGNLSVVATLDCDTNDHF